MTDAGSERPARTHPQWLRKALIAVAGAAVVVAAVFLAAAFVPRWWSQRVADQVNGNFTAGISLGLFYGFVFTLLPLLVLSFAFRKRRPLQTWGWLTLLALVIAVPNLFTLGIVFGTGGAAHAGERTLDVEAPGFRNASLAGAVAAAVGLVALEYLLAGRRRARRRLGAMSEELRARDEPHPPPG